MGTLFNDEKAGLNEFGGLSLGKGLTDYPYGSMQDGQANATYKYAKNDFELFVPASLFVSDTQPALTFDGTRTTVPLRALAASTTHKVIVPSPEWHRTYSFVPHGVMINSYSVFYRVNTTTLTSLTTTLQQLQIAAASALPAAAAVTGVVSGNTLTAAANVYEMVFTVTTPAFVTTSGLMQYGLLTAVIPGSSTCDMIGAVWRGAVAWY
jgi:hypothetical protein